MFGLGCMRLSTAADRDEARAIAVIRAAIEAGASLLDTADVYGLGEHDVGHNERLVAKAVSSSRELRDRVIIATKGGLIRSGASWRTDGRAKHIRAACEASLCALGVERIDLYQLHAPAPDTPISTSVRALLRLQSEGKIDRIGVCNVTVDQLEEARSICEIGAVQIALGPFAEQSFRGGVPEHCRSLGVRLIAHSPLGGKRSRARLVRHPVLRAIALEREVSPALIALAWLTDLAPNVCPIPGATRVESAMELAKLPGLALSEEERARLLAALPFGRLLASERATRRPGSPDGEVVLLMGMPGSGKSTHARRWTDQGYRRLNRDEHGGRMSALHGMLDRWLASDTRRVIADNTYPTRAVRNEAIETAWKHGAIARCVFLDTPIEEAQINAVLRMLQMHGDLLEPSDIRRASKRDPNTFGPDAQHRFLRTLEPPTTDEGFESVERMPFVRAWPKSYRGRALFVELEALRRSRSGARAPLSIEDQEVLVARADRLRDHQRIIALAWLPEIASAETTRERVLECFRAVVAELEIEMELAYCPHPAGPPICWCRRPLPGLGVRAIRTHELDPASCLMVGRSPADRTFAERLGIPHRDEEDFFRA
jgi:aryl-alcohol dehydrogenase-like predicted oxidoreductase/predicted kinase